MSYFLLEIEILYINPTYKIGVGSRPAIKWVKHPEYIVPSQVNVISKNNSVIWTVEAYDPGGKISTMMEGAQVIFGTSDVVAKGKLFRISVQE